MNRLLLATLTVYTITLTVSSKTLATIAAVPTGRDLDYCCISYLANPDNWNTQETSLYSATDFEAREE